MTVKGGACTVCGRYTQNVVREPNICRDLPLCDECKKRFVKCKGCGGHYYPEDLKEGYCSNCK